MNEHTPGPWNVYGLVDESLQGGGRFFEVDADPPHGGLWIAKAQTEANARLIAASPVLLAALEPLAAIYDPSMDDRRDESPAYGFNDKVITYGDIRRAIKAIAAVSA